MMRRVSGKLRSRSGETIAETLIGVLIAALALTMLAGAISASLNVITTSETKMNAYYDENEKVVGLSSGTINVSIEIDNGAVKLDGSKDAVPVSAYANRTFTAIPVAAYN